MAQGYSQPNMYAEHHMETLDCKIENAHRIINRSLRFTSNPAHYKAPSNNSVEVGDFFESYSCNITKFALEYYLHEVVTPGVPEFSSANERNQFWRCVCSNKLLAIKYYLDEEEYYRDTAFLNTLYVFVNHANTQIRNC